MPPSGINSKANICAISQTQFKPNATAPKRRSNLFLFVIEFRAEFLKGFSEVPRMLHFRLILLYFLLEYFCLRNFIFFSVARNNHVSSDTKRFVFDFYYNLPKYSVPFGICRVITVFRFKILEPDLAFAHRTGGHPIRVGLRLPLHPSRLLYPLFLLHVL